MPAPGCASGSRPDGRREYTPAEPAHKSLTVHTPLTTYMCVAIASATGTVTSPATVETATLAVTTFSAAA